MHRAYQPILPCGNKYLQQKWDQAIYEEHKKKILLAKPVVDTSTPPTYGHLHLKLRKLKMLNNMEDKIDLHGTLYTRGQGTEQESLQHHLLELTLQEGVESTQHSNLSTHANKKDDIQKDIMADSIENCQEVQQGDIHPLEKERLSIIERDNRLLLEKMAHIMRTQGRVDNKNDYKAKSLNREKREQELLRVSQENCAILERIIKCKPQYKIQKWNEDWQKAEKYMDSIARYPRGLCKTQKQMFNEMTPKKDRQKDKQLKDESLTNKTKEGEEMTCKNKEANNEHQRENPVEKV